MNEFDEFETPETAVVIQNEPTDVNLIALSGLSVEAAKAKVEAMATILDTFRKAAIKLTKPRDWNLYRSKEGHITAYLHDSGCQRVRALFGISIKPDGKMELISGDAPNDFAYSILGTGHSRLTGEVVEGVEGMKTSDEILSNPNFKNLHGARLKAQVRKHTLANMHGTVTRKLTGLSNVPAEMLQESGMDITQCIQARGFGTQAERSGAKMQTSTGADMPSCPKCNGAMKFVEAGTRQDNSTWKAFYSCAKGRGNCDGYVDAASWHAKHGK